MKSSELYEDWGLPYIIIGSGVLIAREQALRVIELLYEKVFTSWGMTPLQFSLMVLDNHIWNSTHHSAGKDK